VAALRTGTARQAARSDGGARAAHRYRGGDAGEDAQRHRPL